MPTIGLISFAVRILPLLISLVAFTCCSAVPEEFRAYWVSAWYPGYQNRDEVRQLISDIRSAHCNAVFIQVRKRGDAYYNNSPYEPRALPRDNFDPLAEVIRQAHDTNSGQWIEVHAWINTYPIAAHGLNLESGRIEDFQKDPDHPFNRHRDWLSKTRNGGFLEDKIYYFDPAHPQVQQYLFDVAMDIISRYDIDGFHLDHLRYPSTLWGYNETSVRRFDALNNRSGTPAVNDPDWAQFRRDQVTALLRKIYLSAIAKKPQLKISASTVAWTPTVTSVAQWKTGPAYTSALQDWYSWMREGILDLNVIMDFYDQSEAWRGQCYSQWLTFSVENQFDRATIVGQGSWLNSVPNTLRQIRMTRVATPLGNTANGVALYAYGGERSQSDQRQNLLFALSHKNQYDPSPAPVFNSIVSTPEMPWKITPKKGHLKGTILVGEKKTPVDGGQITINGGSIRKLTSDATGFFGTTDLNPGRYSVAASAPGYSGQTNEIDIVPGKIYSQDFFLHPGP